MTRSTAAKDVREPFVSVDWLRENLDAPDLVVIDGSYYLATMKRDPEAEFLAGHIPGAVRFDIDTVKDHANPLPHMLPDGAGFAEAVGAMGIGDDTRIVIYDGAGLYSAPRVWWMFTIFGARDVRILDGGLPAGARLAGRLRKAQPGRGPNRASRQSCIATPSRIWRQSRRHWPTRSCRSSMRAPPSASGARRRSRVQGSRTAICRAVSACPSVKSWRTVASRTRLQSVMRWSATPSIRSAR